MAVSLASHIHLSGRPLRHLILLAATVTAGSAIAQEAPIAEEPASTISSVVVEEVAGSASQGRIAANLASGTNNQQANSAVLAIGGTAIAHGSISQQMSASGAANGSVSAVIEGAAFAASSGLLAVNIAAGSDNQQANLAVIAIGIEGQAATEAMLSQTRASQQPSGEPGEPNFPEAATGISPDAFQGSAGLVQVNLIGGERNSSANTFALTVAAGANP